MCVWACINSVPQMQSQGMLLDRNAHIFGVSLVGHLCSVMDYGWDCIAAMLSHCTVKQNVSNSGTYAL